MSARPALASALLLPFGTLADAFLRVLSFGRRRNPGPQEPRPRRRLRPLARRSRARASKLAARGVPRVEIARRLGISQDAVGMLLHLGSLRAAESAGSGTFFRAGAGRAGSAGGG